MSGTQRPYSRARSRTTGTGSRASGSGSRGVRASGNNDSQQQRDPGVVSPLMATGQVTLGIIVSLFIGFVAFGIIAGVMYLIYSMFK